AISIRLGARFRYQKMPAGISPTMGSMANIVIRNFRASLAARSFRDVLIENGIEIAGPVHSEVLPITGQFISGLPGHPVENVLLENITITGLTGGGTDKDTAREIPEIPERYPYHDMFGRLPAYGMYIRHARNVILRNVSFSREEADARPTIFTDDVANLRAESVGTSGQWRIVDRADPQKR
ncbi:MAG: hypothetical protein ACREH8_24215, partial [Opitutaceae bacterium]